MRMNQPAFPRVQVHQQARALQPAKVHQPVSPRVQVSQQARVSAHQQARALVFQQASLLKVHQKATEIPILKVHQKAMEIPILKVHQKVAAILIPIMNQLSRVSLNQMIVPLRVEQQVIASQRVRVLLLVQAHRQVQVKVQV